MADLDPVFDSARTPWGTPRFYPPGHHPAGLRWREQLAALESCGLGESEVAEYGRNLLASFEQGESEAKQLWLRMASRA